MNTGQVLGPDGLRLFRDLESDAVSAVAERFYLAHGSTYERFGPRGREACREDLASHLEFLRPVLEFGVLRPMVDYLAWLGGMLASRAISTTHVALSLEWLGEFFVERMAAPDGAAVTAAFEAAANFMPMREAPAPESAPAEPWPEAAQFESALLAGHRHQALTIVNRCLDHGRSLVDLELHVMLPSLEQIGEKWQANRVTVAQEHMATAIVESVMTAALLRAPPPPMIDKRILLACVEGNHHAVGLRMVSDAFQLAGWDVQYLGASMPTAALVAQVVSWKPDLVGLSISLPQQLRLVKEVVAELERRLGSARPGVMIGGRAINRFSELAGVVGADAYSPNAPAAVTFANRLPATGGANAVVPG